MLAGAKTMDAFVNTDGNLLSQRKKWKKMFCISILKVCSRARLDLAEILELDYDSDTLPVHPFNFGMPAIQTGHDYRQNPQKVCEQGVT